MSDIYYKGLNVKTFNKSQSVLYSLLCLLRHGFAGSFIFFVLYFSQIKNLKPLKAVCSDPLMRTGWIFFTDSLYFICCDYGYQSFSLCCTWSRICRVSLIIPVAALIKLNEKKENIFGDARFATINDIRESNSFTLDGDEKDGIIVGIKRQRK